MSTSSLYRYTTEFSRKSSSDIALASFVIPLICSETSKCPKYFFNFHMVFDSCGKHASIVPLPDLIESQLS